MKKRFLLVIICIYAVGAFAQTRTPARRRTPTRKPATAANKPAAKQQVAADTVKRTVAIPDSGKKFTRPVDGYFVKNDMQNARPTPYPNVREADIIYAKRIWRDIDLREKMNTYMASPKARLIDILVDAIKDGELTAYDATQTKDDPDGDAFSRALTPAQAMATLVDSALVTKSDTAGNVVSSTMQARDFNGDSILRFRIKEDWIFDKQRSVFEPRIIGIAPLIKPRVNVAGIDVDMQPAFWVYFPEARKILATKEVVSSYNDATGLSYDDAFMKRMFSSYITKESNNNDERIKDYAQGLDRLYESDRIKKELMDWELDLWQY
jgi:gliding motility associated protien GldN